MSSLFKLQEKFQHLTSINRVYDFLNQDDGPWVPGLYRGGIASEKFQNLALENRIHDFLYQEDAPWVPCSYRDGVVSDRALPLKNVALAMSLAAKTSRWRDIDFEEGEAKMDFYADAFVDPRPPVPTSLWLPNLRTNNPICEMPPPVAGANQKFVCENCRSGKTLLWHLDPTGARLCNPCFQFQELYGYPRLTPKPVKSSGLISKKTVRFRVGDIPHWRSRSTESTCGPSHGITPPSLETVNPHDCRDDESVESLDPPSLIRDTESWTVSSISDPDFPHATAAEDIQIAVKNHIVDIQIGVKEHIVDKLWQRAYDLLGYRSWDDSASCSSEGNSSDVEDGSSRFISRNSKSPKPHQLGDVSADASESHQSSPKGARGSSGGRNTNEGHDQHISKSTGKRKRIDNGGGAESDDGEHEKKRERDPKPRLSSRREPRFACPFYKKSPEIHGRNASCLWPGFNTISRLKAHLYRVHMRVVEDDNVCPRCRQAFDRGSDLVTHLASDDRCVFVVVPQQEDGLDEHQAQRLRSRDRGADPTDKWRHIYRLCHRLPDGADTPSPYCDQDSPTDQAVEGYDWYQRQHLPDMIREYLERDPEIGFFVEGLGDRLPAMIRECQNSLHRRFTGLRGSVGDTIEHHRPVVDSQPAMGQPEGSAPAGPPASHSTMVPVAFEAPPSTDAGMTSSEAQQVHARSVQQSDGNSDSGYGTFDPQQPGQTYPADCANLNSSYSRGIAQPESLSRQQMHPEVNRRGEEIAPAAYSQPPGEGNIEESSQRSSSLIQADGLQPQSRSLPAFGTEAELENLSARNVNMEGDPSEVSWMGNFDWTLFPDGGSSTMSLLDDPALFGSAVAGGSASFGHLEPDFDFGDSGDP